MIYPDEEKVTYDYNLGGQVDHVRGYKSYGYDYVNSEFSGGGNTGMARFSLYVSPYLVAGQGSKHTKHILHFRAGRKSFSKWFGISAHGESRFPSSLAFPRWAKVVFRVVWHFRAGRKSFSEWFDACANRLFIKKLLLSGKPSPDIKVKGRNPLSDSNPFCYLCFCEKTSITWAKVHILSGNNS